MYKRRTTSPRKTPVQKRSGETVSIILEAAARILEAGGFAKFNTNAVATTAGVSIGSLYQYFPNKDALLSALINREIAPLLSACESLADASDCESALHGYIRASMHHQMRRPRLAMLIDIAETREAFQQQVLSIRARLQAVIDDILALPGGPNFMRKQCAAGDLLAIIRSLIDAAGEREEAESDALVRRVEGAAWGYLRSAQPSSPVRRS